MDLKQLAERAEQNDPSLFDPYPLYNSSVFLNKAMAELLRAAAQRIHERYSRQ